MQADDTRARILAHGRTLMLRDGVGAVRMADVAAAVGVSRQAVYLHFANRAELLTEIVRDQDLTHPYAQAIRAALTTEPVEDALPALIRAWFRYVPTALPLLAALEAAATTDDAAREAWTRRKYVMREMLHAIVRRLEEAGRLRDGWTAKRATDWIVVKLHPTLWKELTELGWSSRAILDQVLDEVAGVVRVAPGT